jgi:hypothetical protein
MTGKLTIAILDRGWVFIGRISEDSTTVTLSNADCIRRWGTKKGIGELALTGATPSTILEPAGTVRVPKTAVIALIDVSESAWPGR